MNALPQHLYAHQGETSSVSPLRAILEDRNVPYHFSRAYSGEQTFLVTRNAALAVLHFVHKHGERVGLQTERKFGKLFLATAFSDSELLHAPGIRVVDQTGTSVAVLFCEVMPDGTWLTRYRDAPISRVWPPRKGAEEYADARFLTDRHLAYVRPDSEVRLTDMHQPRKVGPIDVVLTWVDGDDPAWRAKKALLTGTQAIRAADNDQRFHSRDELRYSLRSIFQHAPWVRNIYVVTDEQRPSWLGNSDRVRIIDHKEIFENPELLPVFNSHAIETQLHRIPGLSEWFLYMNDDMMLARDVKPSVFFSEDGLSQIFISQVSMIDRTRPAEACVPTDFAGFNMQDIIERDFGVVPCRKMLHAPYVLRKSIIEEIQARYHNEVKMTAASKLRSSTDIAIPSMFYHYYAWLTGRADLRKRGSERYTYIDTGKAGLNEALASTARNPPHFLCLNATEFDEVGKDREAELILQFLQRLYPTKMPFEI